MARYLFVLFTGHGSRTTRDEDLILLDDGPIQVDKLFEKCRSVKATFVIDSCRKSPSVEPLNLTSLVKEAAELGEITLQESRDAFDESIKLTHNGVGVCHSCIEEQESFDGLFTNLLIGGALEWAKNQQHKSLLTTEQAVQRAAGDVFNKALGMGMQQSPEFTGKPFPFSLGIRKRLVMG